MGGPSVKLLCMCTCEYTSCEHIHTIDCSLCRDCMWTSSMSTHPTTRTAVRSLQHVRSSCMYCYIHYMYSMYCYIHYMYSMYCYIHYMYSMHCYIHYMYSMYCSSPIHTTTYPGFYLWGGGTLVWPSPISRKVPPQKKKLYRLHFCEGTLS